MTTAQPRRGSEPGAMLRVPCKVLVCWIRSTNWALSDSEVTVRVLWCRGCGCDSTEEGHRAGAGESHRALSAPQLALRGVLLHCRGGLTVLLPRMDPQSPLPSGWDHRHAQGSSQREGHT